MGDQDSLRRQRVIEAKRRELNRYEQAADKLRIEIDVLVRRDEAIRDGKPVPPLPPQHWERR
jgi:hypothetical protein